MVKQSKKGGVLVESILAPVVLLGAQKMVKNYNNSEGESSPPAAVTSTAKSTKNASKSASKSDKSISKAVSKSITKKGGAIAEVLVPIALAGAQLAFKNSIATPLKTEIQTTKEESSKVNKFGKKRASKTVSASSLKTGGNPFRSTARVAPTGELVMINAIYKSIKDYLDSSAFKDSNSNNSIYKIVQNTTNHSEYICNTTNATINTEFCKLIEDIVKNNQDPTDAEGYKKDNTNKIINLVLYLFTHYFNFRANLYLSTTSFSEQERKTMIPLIKNLLMFSIVEGGLHKSYLEAIKSDKTKSLMFNSDICKDMTDITAISRRTIVNKGLYSDDYIQTTLKNKKKFLEIYKSMERSLNDGPLLDPAKAEEVVAVNSASVQTVADADAAADGAPAAQVPAPDGADGASFFGGVGKFSITSRMHAE